jgi:hypothetical protein
MTNGLALVLPNDRTSAPATRHDRKNQMRRRPIGPQSDVIRMAVVAERCRIACRTILSDAKLRKPRQRNPYGESRPNPLTSTGSLLPWQANCSVHFSRMARNASLCHPGAIETRTLEGDTSTETKTVGRITFKETTRRQWDEAAGAWNRWGALLTHWLGPATDLMLDMTGVTAGSRVLDVAATK